LSPPPVPVLAPACLVRFVLPTSVVRTGLSYRTKLAILLLSEDDI